MGSSNALVGFDLWVQTNALYKLQSTEDRGAFAEALRLLKSALSGTGSFALPSFTSETEATTNVNGGGNYPAGVLWVTPDVTTNSGPMQIQLLDPGDLVGTDKGSNYPDMFAYLNRIEADLLNDGQVGNIETATFFLTRVAAGVRFPTGFGIDKFVVGDTVTLLGQTFTCVNSPAAYPNQFEAGDGYSDGSKLLSRINAHPLLMGKYSVCYMTQDPTGGLRLSVATTEQDPVPLEFSVQSSAVKFDHVSDWIDSSSGQSDSVFGSPMVLFKSDSKSVNTGDLSYCFQFINDSSNDGSYPTSITGVGPDVAGEWGVDGPGYADSTLNWVWTPMPAFSVHVRIDIDLGVAEKAVLENPMNQLFHGLDPKSDAIGSGQNIYTFLRSILNGTNQTQIYRVTIETKAALATQESVVWYPNGQYL